MGEGCLNAHRQINCAVSQTRQSGEGRLTFLNDYCPDSRAGIPELTRGERGDSHPFTVSDQLNVLISQAYQSATAGYANIHSAVPSWTKVLKQKITR